MKKHKYIYKLMLLLAIFLLTNTASYAENNVTVLKNGLRVLVKEDSRFPLASVRLYVHAGGAYESEDKAGMSHLLEHMVFRGTSKRPDGSVAKEMKAIGGNFNAYTSADETVYYTNVPSSEWKKGLDIVGDMAFNALLDPKILEEEKEVVYAEMGQRREDPHMKIYEDSIALALDNTPYRFGVLGTKETVASVSVEDLKKYINTYYNPQNMLLVVVGDVKKQEVIEEAERYFSSMENKEIQLFPSSVELPLFNETKLEIAKNPNSNVLLNLSFPTPSIYDESSNSLDILALLLGGLDTSLLKKKFERDEKIVNSIAAYNIGYNRVSLFTISVDLEKENLERFMLEIIPLLANLSADDFTQKQLDTAKFLYETSFERRKSTVEGYARLLGDSEFASPGEFSIENYLYSIEQINNSNIQKAIDMYIKPSNMAINLLLPEEMITENKIPNFLEAVEANWVEDNSMSNIIADAVYYKSILPENVKIIEESEDRLVLEYAKGSQLILLFDETMPFFSAELKFLGGNSLLLKENEGLSSMLDSMLTEATEKLDREAFSAYLSEKAIGISASATRESFNLNLDAPTKFEKEAFNQLSEVINHPAFAEKDWANVKESLKADARQRAENPASLLFSEIYPSIFSDDNVYGYKLLVSEDKIESFTLNEVKELWQVQMQKPWILTVAGDFDLINVLEFAKQLPLNNDEIQLAKAPNWQENKKKTFVLEDKNHAYIMQLFPTVPYTHEDSAALAVLNNVLGDMSGLLFMEVREKRGLAYQAAPINLASPKAGALAFYVNTALENEDKILPVFEIIIKDLQNDPLPKDVIDAAKLSIKTDYIAKKQSLAARVSEAATNRFLGRDLDYDAKFIDEVQKITAEDVQKVAQKYLLPQESYIIKVTSN